jgi:hypothetical protein
MAGTAKTSELGPSWLQRMLCRECFPVDAHPVDEKSADPRTDKGSGAGIVPIPEAAATATLVRADPDGVAALLAIASDTVADERERGRALDTKTASLAGFTGLILSVNGALASLLFTKKLGSVGKPVALSLLFIALGLLLLALLLAIEGVLMPQRYRGMRRQQLRDFNSPATQGHDALWVHQSMLGALENILAQDRPVNDCKAKLTKRVARLLSLAFVFVAAAALTIGISQL